MMTKRLKKSKGVQHGTRLITVRLPESMVKWVDSLAQQQGRTRNNTLVFLIKTWMDADKGK